MKLKRIISYVILLIILLLGLSFAAINADSVTINYYLGTSALPLSLLLVYALGLGILLGFLTLIVPMLKLKHENRSLKHSLDAITKSSRTVNAPIQS